MTGRTRKEASDRFRDALQEVLGCVSADGLIASSAGSPPDSPSRTLALIPIRNPTPLPGAARLSLGLTHEYTVAQERAGRWHAHTTSYVYHLHDDTGQIILGYHWHPETVSRVDAPHLHVYVNEPFGGRPLSRIHFLTRHITLADVIQFVVEEFQVVPRRPDWRNILERTRGALERPSI